MGPTLRTLIPTKFITMMLAKGYCIQLLSTTSMRLISLVCFTFVDDTDLPVTGERHSTGQNISLQEALDQWAGALPVTGGELIPQKSWCYLVDFIWTGTKWKYRSITEMPAEFTLTERNRDRHILVRLKVLKGRKHLGVYITINSNERAQEGYLKKVREFGEQIRSSQCTLDTVN